jgi:hypothetical protein
MGEGIHRGLECTIGDAVFAKATEKQIGRDGWRIEDGEWKIETL